MTGVRVAGPDWAAVAQPQEDGSDGVAALAMQGGGRYDPAVRAPRVVPADAVPIWQDGRARFISMSAYEAPAPELQDMPLDDERVAEALRLVALWPAVRRLCAEVLVAVCPMQSGRGAGGHGGTCGHYGEEFGWIYATADNAWGFAEGMVHEMAHWKLRALGVWFEEWTPDLLLNAPTELYASPVRKDKLRPMGAVLHAQYSYIHVAEMCTRMLEVDATPGSGEIEWTALQVARITEGQATVRASARGTPEMGAPFLDGLDAWTSAVIARGNAAVTAAKQRAAEVVG